MYRVDIEIDPLSLVIASSNLSQIGFDLLSGKTIKDCATSIVGFEKQLEKLAKIEDVFHAMEYESPAIVKAQLVEALFSEFPLSPDDAKILGKRCSEISNGMSFMLTIWLEALGPLLDKNPHYFMESNFQALVTGRFKTYIEWRRTHPHGTWLASM